MSTADALKTAGWHAAKSNRDPAAWWCHLLALAVLRLGSLLLLQVLDRAASLRAYLVLWGARPSYTAVQLLFERKPAALRTDHAGFRCRVARGAAALTAGASLL